MYRREKPNMNFNPVKGDDFLNVCPYDKSHTVLKEKFANHIAKCRIQYEAKCKREGVAVSVKLCPFNFLHHIPVVDFDKHVRTCQEESGVVPDLTGHEDDIEIQLSRRRPKPVTDWSGGAQAVGDPDYATGCQLRANSQGFTYYRTGMTPSEKKVTREGMRKFPSIPPKVPVPVPLAVDEDDDKVKAEEESPQMKEQETESFKIKMEEGFKHGFILNPFCQLKSPSSDDEEDVEDEDVEVIEDEYVKKPDSDTEYEDDDEDPQQMEVD